MSKPIYLIDLDDNIFQTKRKLEVQNKKAFKIAALDRQLNPRSFLTHCQSNFIDWLLKNADVIPVTARGTEETSRVNIGFNSWKVMTHGAVITNPNGDTDSDWKNHVSNELSRYQKRLQNKQKILTKAFEDNNIKAWARINYEYKDLAIYLVIKHTDSTQLHEIYDVADKLDEKYGIDGFYIHRNGNNIAWIPKCIQKGLAVEFLLNKLKTEEKGIPVIGFGDSISDHTFLKQCDWFGMPKSGQITSLLNCQIDKLEQKND